MKVNTLQLKREVSTFLLVLLLSAVGMTKVFAQSFTVGDLNYSINSDGVSVTVTGHVDGTAATGELVIPETVTYNESTYSVTAIGDYAFNYCTRFTGNLVIPNSVTTIGENAFSNCYRFTGYLVIPNSVTSIGSVAFNGCTGFTGNLTIGNSVTTICNYAFSDCHGITGDLVIPNSVTTIGSAAFANCYGFNGDLTIGNSVTTIGGCAFQNCYGFNGDLTIGSSVSTIDYQAFYGCTGFSSVEYNATNCADASSTWHPFQNCGGQLIIGENVERIPAYMFWNAAFTGSLVIPNSVTSIGSAAFYECTGFTGNLVIFNSVTSIGSSAFYNCTGFTGNLVIPNSVTIIGDDAFCYCSGFTGNLVIPNSVTTIGEYAFYDCTGFSSVEYNATNCADVSDWSPFKNCGGTLTIGENVERIPDKMFENAAFTGSLIIPTSVTYIGFAAFDECIGFSSVEYNATNCADADAGAFYGCGGTLTIGENVERIPAYMFRNAAFTGNLVIPNSVTAIGSYAFGGCEGFTGDLVIPNSVTTIPANAFHGCTGFTGNLVIPNFVTSIGYQAFYNCTGFSSVEYDATNCADVSYWNATFHGCGGTLTIGENVERIPAYMFASAAFTGSLIIPNSVNTIGECAFNNCTGFTGNLVISNSVTSIGSSAFYNCTGFSSVEYDATNCADASSWNAPFRNCGGMLIIGENVERIPANMFKQTVFTLIISHAEIPPTVGTNAFYGIDHDIPVFVPCGTLINYQNTEGWNEFTNISSNCLDITAAVIPANSGTVTGAGTYDMYTTCTLTAIANEGYIFLYWTEDETVVSTDATYSFVVTEDRNLVANFTLNTYDVTVIANPAEGGTVTGTGTYDYGSLVNITATANDGYSFANWTENGAIVSMHNSYTFTIYDDHDFVANFTVKTYNVTVAASPVGAGNVYGSGTFEEGTLVTIATTANVGYTFNNWTEDGEVVSTDESYTFTITDDHNFFANFTINTYNVTVAANPVEGGTVTGEGTYDHGSSVTVTATANEFYTFFNWTEDETVVSTDATYAFVVTADRNLVANFTIITYEVTVTANPVEGGTVAGAGTYDYGTLVTIAATANVGYTFNNWTEDDAIVSTDASYTFTIVEDHELVANFTINTYNVTVAADPAEGGTVTGAGSYDYGTSVTVTATAIEEYSFINWTEDGEVVSTDESYTFIIANDHDFVANFAMITYDVTVTANPVEGGIVTGAGTYAEGRAVTIVATANTGYTFDNWTEDGEVVSTDESYTFTIYDDHDFVANFTINTYNVTVTANPAEGGTVTGASTYDYGTSVTIAATANTGYTFDNWTEDGEVVSTDESYSFTIADDHDFVANFTINTYNVTVAADPVEGGTVTGAGTYDYGTSVTITATAIEEYSFVNWTEDGEVVSTDESYIFIIANDHDFVANFAMITYDVTVTANPVEGGIVTGAGTYAEGRPVTISATANVGYTFDNWTEDGEVVSTDESYTFTIYDDHDFVANFTIITYEVTVTANPVEGGTVTGAGTYDYGTSVTVTATANDGYTFYRWTENGSDVSYSSSYSFVVTEDCNLVANFVAPSMNTLSIGDYTGAEGEILTININLANENEVAGFQFDIPLNEGFTYVEGSIVKGVRCAPSHIILTQMVGDGTTLRVICYSVNPPANISGNDGTIASLQIILGEGGIYELGLENCIISSIYGYSLPCIGIGGSLTVGTFNVTVAANPAEGGTVTGAGTYDYGTSVTVTATANEFYVFVNWTEGDVEVSTDASYTFTITEDHDLVANFILPGLLGDANNDHVVNVADVQAVVSYLYGYYLPTFNFINADANEDGVIDIGDIQAILMIIQNQQPDKSMGGKPVIYTIENGVLNISLTEELSAMQIMVDAPIEIANTDVFDGFTTVIDRVQGTDSYMLLAYSLEGKTVKPGKYAILNIADGTIEQITFSTPTAATVDGIEGDPLGIGEETVTANVYPNPTQGMITIEAENMSEIVISNMMGQIVARYSDINGSSANINMNGFEKGTYLVRIITGSSVIVKNVVKM